MKSQDAIREFIEALPFKVNDRKLFEKVFVHSSYLNERGGTGLQSNERLEFLGDAVLSSVVSHLLHERFPKRSEGELTVIRARLVNRTALALLGKQLCLGDLVFLGKGEERSGGRENPSIIANTFEALIAAIYLDQDYCAVFSFISALVAPLMDSSVAGTGHFDFKPRLQELTQSHFKSAPEYRVVKESGLPHEKIFKIEVVVNGKTLGSGEAGKKKDAEQMAAEAALAKLAKKGVVL